MIDNQSATYGIYFIGQLETNQYIGRTTYVPLKRPTEYGFVQNEYGKEIKLGMNANPFAQSVSEIKEKTTPPIVIKKL